MLTTNKISIILISLALISCETSTEKAPGVSADEIAEESQRANDFFEKSFNESVDRNPVFQAQLGIKKDYDKWNDISDENTQKELEITKGELQWLRDSINFDALDDQTQISYDLFVLNAENEINNFEYRFHNYPVNQMFGTHSQIPSFLINLHRITNVEDANAYILRLINIESLFEQLLVNLKVREEKGIIPPKFVFPRVIADSENILVGKPFDNSGENSTILDDFVKKVNALDTIDDNVKKELIQSAGNALETYVKPSYEKLIAFMRDQESRATTADGAWKFPDGEDFYNIALKRTTTTELTADEIHDIGLREVERIHGEMKDIMATVGFEGSLQEFFQFMRTDDQFYYPNTDQGKEDYMKDATALIDNMKSRLDELFLTKPKAEMIVKRVEAFREQSTGKAFYNRPAPDGSRPGYYYANLYNTQDMPNYDMEALAYHEGIPGHHMQIAIAQELENVPKFRKFGGYTAYIEGWGLYSEFLPKEMGLYADPFSDFGRLAAELWRSCRLVVDTGIHSNKWTREEGIQYYKKNTPGSDRDCERMVERHIVMPSQATAYKVGMMKILELRELAQDELGDKFDIREFHDVVLKNGAVPLNILEKLVNDWIDGKNAD